MRGEIKSAGLTLTPQSDDDLLLVEGYGNGGFKMRGSRIMGSMLVMPTGFFPLEATSIDALTLGHLEKLFDAEYLPEILLIGTGERMMLLPAPLKADLKARGIGFDPMDTGAAARTFNVLTMEARRVAAVLIAV